MTKVNNSPKLSHFRLCARSPVRPPLPKNWYISNLAPVRHATVLYGKFLDWYVEKKR